MFLIHETPKKNYGIVPVTLALALLINFFLVFHGLKTFFLMLFIEA
jgi:hypothetical protein